MLVVLGVHAKMSRSSTTVGILIDFVTLKLDQRIQIMYYLAVIGVRVQEQE